MNNILDLWHTLNWKTWPILCVLGTLSSFFFHTAAAFLFLFCLKRHVFCVLGTLSSFFFLHGCCISFPFLPKTAHSLCFSHTFFFFLSHGCCFSFPFLPKTARSLCFSHTFFFFLSHGCCFFSLFCLKCHKNSILVIFSSPLWNMLWQVYVWFHDILWIDSQFPGCP